MKGERVAAELDRELHFALKEKAVLGEPVIEPCLVGCGALLRFFYFEGEGFGYCARCDIHERIVTASA